MERVNIGFLSYRCELYVEIVNIGLYVADAYYTWQ